MAPRKNKTTAKQTAKAGSKQQTNAEDDAQLRFEQDSPWKEIIGDYFDDFIAFAFPFIYAEIDWTKGYEQLDTELAKIKRASKTNKRLADKLVKVFLKSGKETWLLIHVEIQGYNDPNFAERIYNYSNLIENRYKREVVSLAIFTDDDPKYHPTLYEWQRWGNYKRFEFTTLKLLNLRPHWGQLEQDPNPFALVAMAQLKTLELKTKSNQLLAWKLQLARLLRERQWSENKIIGIFRFLDWIMALPEDLEITFEEEIAKEENPMPYLSPIERRIEKRLTQQITERVEQQITERVEQQAEKRATLNLVTNTLKAHFGQLKQELEEQLKLLSVQQLSRLNIVQNSFTNLDSLREWLDTNPPEMTGV